MQRACAELEELSQLMDATGRGDWQAVRAALSEAMRLARDVAQQLDADEEMVREVVIAEDLPPAWAQAYQAVFDDTRLPLHAETVAMAAEAFEGTLTELYLPKKKKKAKKKATKKAILIASSAAPGFMGRMLYTTADQLKVTAKTIGAKPIGSVFVGLISQQEHPELPDKVQERVRTMVRKLM